MKEAEIRPRNTFNEYLKLAKEDADNIFSDKTNFISNNCPGCNGKKNQLAFEKHGFNYVECISCDTLFVNPRPTEKDLMLLYEDSISTKFWVNDFFMPVAEERRKKIFRPRAEYISTKLYELGNNKRIGDIGAGFGIFLEELRAFLPNSKLIAIEPSKEMASICRGKELYVIESSLEMIKPDENNFDLLTCFELFEHLYDPRAFLKKVYEILAPGGYIFITTLNGLGFDIQLLWEKSKSVSPPHHLNFFNPNSIKSLILSLGFEITEVSTPGKLDWDIVENVYNNENVNPVKTDDGISEMLDLSEKTGVSVFSICADYYMQKPLIKNGNIENNSYDHLLWLIERASKLSLIYIV